MNKIKKYNKTPKLTIEEMEKNMLEGRIIKPVIPEIVSYWFQLNEMTEIKDK